MKEGMKEKWEKRKTKQNHDSSVPIIMTVSTENQILLKIFLHLQADKQQSIHFMIWNVIEGGKSINRLVS